MDLVLRTAFAFGLVTIVMRLIGRRELSSLEPYDIILLVVIGDLLQQGVTQNDTSITGMTLVILTLALLTVWTSWLGFRFRPVRRVLEGEPLLLLVDGQPIRRNLRTERLTLEELAAEARLQQIPSLDRVRFAVLETNGSISFVTREDGEGGG